MYRVEIDFEDDRVVIVIMQDKDQVANLVFKQCPDIFTLVKKTVEYATS